MMQQEIDKNNHLIQNLLTELNKFRENSLAKFAVEASQNVEVITSID